MATGIDKLAEANSFSSMRCRRIFILLRLTVFITRKVTAFARESNQRFGWSPVQKENVSSTNVFLLYRGIEYFSHQ